MMQISATGPLVLSSLFTLGCMIIHVARGYADWVTVGLAFVLMLVVSSVVVFWSAPATFRAEQTATIQAEFLPLMN